MKTKIILSLLLLTSILVGVISYNGKLNRKGIKINVQDKKLENYKSPLLKNEIYFGSKIPRTMSLLENSTKANPQNLKIHFYGQSIIGGQKKNLIIDRLEKKYPTVKFKVIKNPIGGFRASSLVKVAIHDLYHEYADLIIFHVYGGNRSGDLERIFINIKTKTTAEVIVFNHHISYAGESDYEGSKHIEFLANKYNFEFVDVRSTWENFIEVNPEISIKSLLKDGVYPNKLGNELLAFCILKHFKYNRGIQFSNPNLVYDIDPKTAILDKVFNIKVRGNFNIRKNLEMLKGSEITIEFTGNRVDLITAKENQSSIIEIMIDNQKPLNNPLSYFITRPSSNFNMWWPAIKRIDLNTFILPLTEKYTLEIFSINREKQEFNFTLTGEKSGFDGKGNNRNDFISDSKKISINKDDFTIFSSEKISKKETPEKFKINFEIKKLAYNEVKINNHGQYLLSKGLTNEKHKLTLKIKEGKLSLIKFRVYKPEGIYTQK